MGPSAIRYAGLGERIDELGSSPVATSATWWRRSASGPIPGMPRRGISTRSSRPASEVAGRVAEPSRARASCRSSSAATTRSRSERSAGMASVHGAGRGALDRRARRPEHAGDHAERERPRHAAGGRSRAARGEAFERDAWPLPAVDPERVALIGGRAFDDGERELIRELDLAVFTMAEIDSRGLEPVVREALDRVRGAPFVHVSLDLDVIDPDVAPGVGTPVRGGLSYREAHLAMELVAEAGVARLARGRRGEPDPRPRERDRAPRGRAGRERARRQNPVQGRTCPAHLGPYRGRSPRPRPRAGSTCGP